MNCEQILFVGNYEGQKFLGRPVGFSLLPDSSTVNEALNIGRALLHSMITPLGVFVISALHFDMRC